MSAPFKTRIKMLVMDVDGTLTDGKIYYGNNGEEFKAFNVKDGYALATNKELVTAIITGRESEIVNRRVSELKINEVRQGVMDKLSVLGELLEKYSFSFEEVAYIGDDLNDYAVMKKCGLAACPADAADEIAEISDYVCKARGGAGAVRELLDYISKLNGEKALA